MNWDHNDYTLAKAAHIYCTIVGIAFDRVSTDSSHWAAVADLYEVLHRIDEQRDDTRLRF